MDQKQVDVVVLVEDMFDVNEFVSCVSFSSPSNTYPHSISEVKERIYVPGK
jgi:hypothetical protein